MALQGQFSGTTSNSRIKPTVTWSAVQSAEENWSEITVVLTYSRTNTGHSTAGTWKGSITIGEQTFSGEEYIEIAHNSNTEAMRATTRIYHDADGRAAVTVSAAGAVSGSTLEKTTVSGKLSLDTIPQASTVSATDAQIGSRSTVVITRKNDGFAHSVAYSFGALSGYIDASGAPVATEQKFSSTILNFLLPESFYYQIPGAPAGVCRLTCTTYSGSTRIGAHTAEFTVRADCETCKPIVGGTVRDVNEKTVALTGDPKVLVRYASTARCQMDAQPRNGAHITALRIGGTAVTDAVHDIENPAFDQITFEATDSRGFTTSVDVPVTLIPYVMLTNNATLRRNAPTGNRGELQLQGNCWNGDFGAQSNRLTYEYSVDGGNVLRAQLPIGQSHTFQATKGLTGLDDNTAHTVELTISDALMSVTKTLKLSKGIPVFDWGENDFRFNVPVELPALKVAGMTLAEYIRSIIQGG